MRCKVGDLCIVVNDIERPANNGALVKIIKRADFRDFWPFAAIDWEVEALTFLHCDDGSIANPGDCDIGYRDIELRPIRDQDGQDETFTCAGKPQEVTA